MLKTLNIENIAVIEKAEIEFNKGLNVLTGETGAGKSIVVDSINAVLGERTSKELVRNGADYGFVSALFDDIPQNAVDKISNFGIPVSVDDGLLITRRISANGKSVCKLNGNSVTVSMLKEIGQMLVNIHGQHDSQALLNADLHYQFIDMLLQNKELLDRYKESFHKLITVRRKLKSLTVNEEEKEKKLELLNYQINELENADIKVGERDSLIKRKKLAENAENILSALNMALLSLNGDDENSGASTLILSALTNLQTAFSDSENNPIISKFTDVSETIEEVKDLIEKELDSIDFDENDLEEIEERLDFLYKLSLKYGNTEQEMLDFLENARKQKEAVLYNDDELEKLSELYDEYLEKAVNLAEKLSAERKKTAKLFEVSVKEQLEFLDMPKIDFIVNFEKGNLTSNGFDKIDFLISTNPGEPPKPLAKIASGGELSRIMLAIKSIVAKNDTVYTLIFDEIDTGVSGRASRKIGLRLHDVSKNTQVITVTHSAQIASAADEHYLIEKHYAGDGRTYTEVKPLNFEERKLELARIMGGLEITESLLNSAEELLRQSNNGN